MTDLWTRNTKARDDLAKTDAGQQFRACEVLFIRVPDPLWHARSATAEAVLNTALMNLSSSRFGSVDDRTGCGDCQLSTWDSRPASRGYVG